MKISFVLSIRCRGLASWIWHNISFTAFSWMVVISNLLFVDSNGVRMDVREDRPNMNGEQKFTQPMKLTQFRSALGHSLFMEDLSSFL